MGRKKINKSYTRKLGKIGSPTNHSFYVTLPISFIRGLKWKEAQQLKIKKVGSKVHITSSEVS